MPGHSLQRSDVPEGNARQPASHTRTIGDASTQWTSQFAGGVPLRPLYPQYQPSVSPLQTFDASKTSAPASLASAGASATASVVASGPASESTNVTSREHAAVSGSAQSS